MADLLVYSFGYGHTEPLPDADITVDVRRWFRDPHIDPAMRSLTGLDPAVIQNVTDTRGVLDFVNGLYRAASVLLGLRDSDDETGHAVSVAVGCVGGRHRSVVIAGLLVNRARAAGWAAEVEHLHIDRPVLKRSTIDVPESDMPPTPGPFSVGGSCAPVFLDEQPTVRPVADEGRMGGEIDDRPGCRAVRLTDCHEGPHTCDLERGHPERKHRCPCGVSWDPPRTTLADRFGGAPR